LTRFSPGLAFALPGGIGTCVDLATPFFHAVLAHLRRRCLAVGDPLPGAWHWLSQAYSSHPDVALVELLSARAVSRLRFLDQPSVLLPHDTAMLRLERGLWFAVWGIHGRRLRDRVDHGDDA
jgi:hypothetical protein